MLFRSMRLYFYLHHDVFLLFISSLKVEILVVLDSDALLFLLLTSKSASKTQHMLVFLEGQRQLASILAPNLFQAALPLFF